jgi:ABC-type polysaccharide/polyol phosphate transport system ATPase subunit
MGSEAVTFEEVSKRYPRGGARYGSLRSALASRFAARRRAGELGDQGTLALDRLSLSIPEGESFGIIGPNGAGKTTSLKLISRISYPSSGRVRVRGRVSALIDVAAGVHPELSGRENIWLYGRILGMSRRFVREHFDEIVEFAELGHVLDMPVKFYSSGMQLRLGFSIAAHLEPDIFVVDEALAVGDEGFQAKCVSRMGDLVSEGRTLVLVSHYLPAVEATCRRTLFLRDGQAEVVGPTADVVREYLNWVRTLASSPNPGQVRPSRYVSLEDIGFYSSDGRRKAICRPGEDVVIRMSFRAPAPLASPHVSLGISDHRTGNLITCSMLIDGGAPASVSGDFTVSCLLRSLPLQPRVYELRASIDSPEGFEYFDWQAVATFQVEDTLDRRPGPASQSNAAIGGPIRVPHEWKVDAER